MGIVTKSGFLRALAVLLSTLCYAAGGTVEIGSQSPGLTPFIVNLSVTVSNNAADLKTIRFTIAPMPGSVTRPVSTLYSRAYLVDRGYLNPQNGQVTVPIFGLYSNFNNSVTLLTTFNDNSTQQDVVGVQTAAWNDPCGYGLKTVVQPRTNTTELSYDFINVKNGACDDGSPTILDTDSTPRWVGTQGSNLVTGYFFNGFYNAAFPSGSTKQTGIVRMEWDGTTDFLHDYADIGVTLLHHNMDRGRNGILIEADTAALAESVIIEIDAFGNVLRSWNLADIIANAMIAGGDDPAQFVKGSPIDWFHSNAATYRSSDNTLVVSSRESFVIGVDYDTKAIKWILGDPAKKWYTFASLRQYALTLGPNSLPPTGQHAVSFTHDNALLLFDDGKASLNNTPTGADRTYSAPRKYVLNLGARTANEVWNYPYGQSLFSAFCSSVYEDQPLSYLIDYAMVSAANNAAQLVGLGPSGAKIFDYRYANSGCTTAWNSIPIHMEDIQLTTTLAAPTPTATPIQGSTQVLTATINDSVTGTAVNQWDYSSGDWTYLNGSTTASCYQGDEHYSATTNVVAHFRFNGTQVKIYTLKQPDGGNIGYTLDGGAEQVVSNYNAYPSGNLLSYTSPIVMSGDHDLVIRVVGSHGQFATGNTVTVDKAEVYTTVAPPPTPTVSLSTSSSVITEGSDATITVSVSAVNPSGPTIVNYTITGKAQLGVDYTLSAPAGQITVPAGASSGSVTLHAMADGLPEKKDKLKIKLVKSTAYKLGKAKKATITIVD